MDETLEEIKCDYCCIDCWGKMELDPDGTLVCQECGMQMREDEYFDAWEAKEEEEAEADYPIYYSLPDDEDEDYPEEFPGETYEYDED